MNEETQVVAGERLASVVTAGHGERSGLRAPFPYFGGKSRIAEVVWRALGDVGGYVEPFAGSAAVLLGRPSGHRPVVETINDVDSFVVNFWRALAFSPDEVERWAIWPKAEADLHARGQWLLAGPTVYICDECVGLCADILLEEGDVADEAKVAEAEAKARAAFEAYEAAEQAHWKALREAIAAFRDYRRAMQQSQSHRALLAVALDGQEVLRRWQESVVAAAAKAKAEGPQP